MWQPWRDLAPGEILPYNPKFKGTTTNIFFLHKSNYLLNFQTQNSVYEIVSEINSRQDIIEEKMVTLEEKLVTLQISLDSLQDTLHRCIEKLITKPLPRKVMWALNKWL